MLIFPAIDIHDGKCVRLLRGNIKKKIVYNLNPLNQAQFFELCGFKNLHIVDLDFAITGKLNNRKIIESIREKTNLSIQIGGGIRSYREVKYWFDAGIDTVVIGTMFFEKKKDFEKSIGKFPNKISFAMDLRSNYLAIKGWTRQTKLAADDLINQLNQKNFKSVIYTDINRDGTKIGPNFENLKKYSSRIRVPLIASGGIANMKDVYKLKKIKALGGMIIGKSIYDGSINLSDLIKIQNNA